MAVNDSIEIPSAEFRIQSGMWTVAAEFSFDDLRSQLDLIDNKLVEVFGYILNLRQMRKILRLKS